MILTAAAGHRLAIRELIDQYNDAVMRFDADAWRETWTEDAEWELMGNAVRGRDAIVKLWQQTMQQFEYVVFQTTPGSVEIDGDEATGRVWAVEVLKPKGADKRSEHGRYDDTYRRVDGRWRFAVRRYQILTEF